MASRSRSAVTMGHLLPAFTLYGETGAPGQALLHVESIDHRSRLHNWEIEAHVHPGLQQVLWVRAGTVQAMLDEIHHRLDGPALLIIPSGVAHAFRFNRGCDGHVFTLNAGLLAEGEPLLATRLQALFASAQALSLAQVAAPELLRLQALFEALQTQCQADDAVDAARAGSPVPTWLARALVWRLAECASTLNPPAGDAQAVVGQALLFSRWVALVEAHYGEHWSVSRYCEQLGLTPERLNRLVRAQTGQTAQALVHARLAREAARRLVHIAAPVSRLAFELGFEDPAYFCRFFKRQTGLSPRAYREKAATTQGAVKGEVRPR